MHCYCRHASTASVICFSVLHLCCDIGKTSRVSLHVIYILVRHCLTVTVLEQTLCPSIISMCWLYSSYSLYVSWLGLGRRKIMIIFLFLDNYRGLDNIPKKDHIIHHRFLKDIKWDQSTTLHNKKFIWTDSCIYQMTKHRWFNQAFLGHDDN